MPKEDNVVINPWNNKNKLLTKEDVYQILERGGFTNARDVVKINNLGFYQTAFIHPSYVKKHIFENSVNNNISLSQKPIDALDLFDENNNYEMIVFDDDLDGNPDRIEYDEDDDGTMDVVAYDYNQDGEWDKFEELS
jgi:hypothetical protein